MNLKKLCYMKEASTKDHVLCFHLHAMSSTDKCTETKSAFVAATAEVLEGAGE